MDMWKRFVFTLIWIVRLRVLFLLFLFGVQHDFHISWLTVTRRARWVPLVEQVLIILRSSSFFGYVQIAQSLVFCVVPLYLSMSFLLDIVFSVFRFTASSYILSILKLVLSTDGRHCYGCKTTLPFQPSVCIRIKQTSYRNEN